ncbi:hypothetical protein RHMOL_Rhmol04G0196500 [Rhododendron molle]|uniref:Uncharacterized protein n=1 Tax=Rhododendron molle TaxID=49168 RepID=A0ACC0P3I6_RHOML|nr:hypothetical protein RHMOL_Rhmol04G0196500 [Rhododendron molle]
MSDEALAKLLEDNPAIGELVLKAKKERARAIAASEAAERVERERKEREEPLRDMEAEERAGAGAQWSRVTAVTEAGAVTRPDFSAKAFVPLTRHLFVPSDFVAYVPQQTEYEDELVLRDPEVDIANTWFEVPNEWVNEAVRHMLAMENVIRRAASGIPIELRYPALPPPRAQRAAAQRPQEERDPKRAKMAMPEAAEGEEDEEKEEDE